MVDNNPYTPPQSSSAVSSPSPLLLLWSVGTVFGSAFVGGLIGLSIGAALGSLVPSYYRSVFAGGDLPNFDPIAVGIGQGLSQGIVFGGLIGLALVAIHYWFRSRAQTAPDVN